MPRAAEANKPWAKKVWLNYGFAMLSKLLPCYSLHVKFESGNVGSSFFTSQVKQQWSLLTTVDLIDNLKKLTWAE